MDLGKVAAHLRLRNGYESVDLGVLLARRFALPLWSAWALCVLPFFAFAMIINMLTGMFWIPLFFLWWLKPLYARVPLYILSRAFFGDVPTPRQALNEMPRQWFRLSTLLQLTISRFSSLRGFSSFVTDLEGSNYSESRKRLRVLLNERTRPPSNWLFFVCFSVEITLLIAVFSLLAITIPENFDLDLWESLGGLFDSDITQPFVESAIIAIYALSIMLVEPIYMAGNFGLYISRRVELEGWDIELAFRKLARRLKHHVVDKAKNVAVILVAFSLCFATLPPASAEEFDYSDQMSKVSTSTEDSTRPDPSILIAEILKSPEFGEEKTEKRWRLKEKFQNTDSPLKGVGSWVQTLATALKVLLWAAAILGVAFVVFLLVRRGMARFGYTSRTEKADDWEQALVFTEESGRDGYVLPDDIIAHARKAWRSGEEVRALNLLYLGTLQVLEKRYTIVLDPGQTAYECVRTVRRAGGPHELVAAVANAWTSLLFAQRRPDDATIEALFTRWDATFSVRGIP